MSFKQAFTEFVKTGREILETLSDVQQDIPERRFKGKDVEDRVSVALPTIYTDEGKGKLPVTMERDKMMRRRGYTLKEINILQDHYGTSPRRRDGEDSVTLCFTNQKGGCWKTTTASYAASCYANQGYRVLMVDVDPQASTTENLGFQPNIKILGDQTLAPLILEEVEVNYENVSKVILNTHVENLKLIPSCLEMGYCDLHLTLKMAESKVRDGDTEKEMQDKRHSALRVFTRIRSIIDVIADDFDIIILDGTPSVGLLPINILLASDIVVVPVPTEMPDFAASVGFSDIALSEYDTIEEYLGEEHTESLFPDPVIVPTRYSASQSTTIGSDTMLEAINKTFGRFVTRGFIKKHDGVVSNLTMLRKTVFDVNPGVIKTSVGDISIQSSSRKKAINNYMEVFDQLLNEHIKSYWASRLAERDAYMSQYSVPEESADSEIESSTVTTSL